MLRWRFRNFQMVTIKPPLDARDLRDAEVLVRFMDLPKLFDLLANSRLLLPQLEHLIEGDPFECSASKSYKHLSRQQLEQHVLLRREYAPNLLTRPDILFFHDWFAPSHSTGSSFNRYVQGLSVLDLRKTAWYLERERLKHDLVCSCWYRGRQESDAMWRIHADRTGVAIFSSVSRMRTAIKCCSVPKIAAHDFKLTLAKVRYDDTTESRRLKPWLIKRKAFQHEQEVRLTCDCPILDSPGLALKVDPALLIQEIIVTPFAANWQSEAIIAMVKSGSFHKIRTRKSEHMRPPKTWSPLSMLRPTVRRANGNSHRKNAR